MYPIILRVINFVKHFLAPLFTNAARLGVSKITKSVESKIE
jgi:hypothetical protein